jgi:hypothetical protein
LLGPVITDIPWLDTDVPDTGDDTDANGSTKTTSKYFSSANTTTKHQKKSTKRKTFFLGSKGGTSKKTKTDSDTSSSLFNTVKDFLYGDHTKITFDSF